MTVFLSDFIQNFFCLCNDFRSDSIAGYHSNMTFHCMIFTSFPIIKVYYLLIYSNKDFFSTINLFYFFINSITCVIERQENLFNNYLIDNMIELRTNKFVENQLIGFVGDSSGSSIVLTVTGGGV